MTDYQEYGKVSNRVTSFCQPLQFWKAFAQWKSDIDTTCLFVASQIELIGSKAPT